MASGIQAVIILDEKCLTCSQEMGILTDETNWLAAMIVAQLVKIIFCSILQFLLHRCVAQSPPEELDETVDPTKFKLEIHVPEDDEVVLPTENSYVDFDNNCEEFNEDEHSPLAGSRCNTAGMSETEINYFQFT